jgi:hypothetical protein
MEDAEMAERKQEQSGQRSEDQSLKEREYRDKDGNVHHHTRTYMEQHKGEQRGGGRSSGGEQQGGSRSSGGEHQRGERSSERKSDRSRDDDRED